jgi:type IV secretory pathway TrbD component
MAKEKADAENTVRVERIFGALWRPRLWLGCPVAPLGLLGGSALLCTPVAFHTGNLWWMLAGLVYLTAVIALLRKLTEYDPSVFPVFFRFVNVVGLCRMLHINHPIVRDWFPSYDRHFPARSSVFAPHPDPRRHQR